VKSNEIERALRDDPGMQPSLEFASRVMCAVRRQAGEQEALAFPWARLLTGLAAAALVTVVALALAPPPQLPDSTVRALNDPRLVQASIWVPTSLVGLWMLVRGSLRLAGYRR
jgi:hypothetical protein